MFETLDFDFDFELPEVVTDIIDEHYHEIIGIVLLFISVIALRIFSQPGSTSLPTQSGKGIGKRIGRGTGTGRVIKMPAASPQTVKLKSTLRLLIPRLRNAQKKDTALSIADRREMAELLRQNKEQSARIRVENIIHTDITVELLEILELYAELLLARAGLLDVKDKNIKDGLGDTEGTGLEEAASAIMYAAPRVPRDVRELGMVRSLLIERFGKDFAMNAQENKDKVVPKRVTDKLSVDPPKPELVQAYLEEIAKTYGVDWPLNRQELQDAQTEVDDEDDDEGDDGGAKEQPIPAGGAGPSTPAKSNVRDLNVGPLPPRNQPNVEGSKSPVSVAPPKGTSENPRPGVKLPGGGQVSNQSPGAKKTGPTSGAVGGLGAPPTVDDLAKRFQALKK